MNTFEKHFADFPSFLSGILSWHPDYLVPVARKACKLIKTIELDAPGLDAEAVLRYRTFFQLTGAPVRGKKVAVIDDASQYTSTLSSYRRYFEDQGAIVRTFSFVGHDDLNTGKRLKEDHFAEIGKFLRDPVYNEYILQQSYHLLNSGCHFDLDHIVFAVALPAEQYGVLIDNLVTKGTLLFIPDDTIGSPIERFSLHYPSFFAGVPFFVSSHITLGPIIKLKFAYDKKAQKLFFSPIIFPEWQYNSTPRVVGLTANVPFRLPFTLPDRFDPRNKASVLRVYHNLTFIASVTLAKAFVEAVAPEIQLAGKVKLVTNDLAALLGSAEAARLVESASSYLAGKPNSNYTTGQRHVPPSPKRHSRRKYSSFAQIYDALRNGYKTKVAARSRRADIHYSLSYSTLFRSFPNAIQLSEQIDYFCDLGAIVPETILKAGRACRGCRTGEAEPDPNCIRTDALIALAITVLCDEFKVNSIGPTILHKTLAAFAFDYPKQEYTQLHCLEATPYYFGSFMKVRHPLRWPEPKTLYSLGKSALFFDWNEKRKTFSPKNRKKLQQQVLLLFDQQQQAGYTELFNYLKMLASIARRSTSVDVMNLLSICRDQDVFYAHVDFNLRASCAVLFEHYHSQNTAASEALEVAVNNAESALTKCKLAQEAPRLIEEIASDYATSLEYTHAAHLLRKHYAPFDSETRNLLTHVKAAATTELLLVHLLMWRTKRDPAILERLVHFGLDEEIERRGKADLLKADILQSSIELDDLIAGLFDRLTAMLYALPKPKDTFRSRHINAARESARNSAIAFIAERKSPYGLFLHIDLTGLKRIVDTSREDVLAHFYLIVKEQVHDTGGRILYGGTSGDDAFDVFYNDIEPSLRCVENIKHEFAANMFLNSDNRDVKFGMAWDDFSGSNVGQKVNTAWGEQKSVVGSSCRHSQIEVTY